MEYDIFTGMLVYADDILLSAPSRHGYRTMINAGSKYGISHNLLFSTNTDKK